MSLKKFKYNVSALLLASVFFLSPAAYAAKETPD